MADEGENFQNCHLRHEPPIAGTQGCGGFTSYRNLNRDLKVSTGQDVHVVIQKIGYPTGQAVVAGDKVYAWRITAAPYMLPSMHRSAFSALTFRAVTTIASGYRTDWISENAYMQSRSGDDLYHLNIFCGESQSLGYCKNSS